MHLWRAMASGHHVDDAIYKHSSKYIKLFASYKKVNANTHCKQLSSRTNCTHLFIASKELANFPLPKRKKSRERARETKQTGYENAIHDLCECGRINGFERSVVIGCCCSLHYYRSHVLVFAATNDNNSVLQRDR